MKILAVEFSSPQRSVAVVCAQPGGDLFRSEVLDASRPGTAALGMVEKALAEARVQREQIEVIAIGIGPGSYTGIRAAIALAQGWQLARPVLLLGISSAECIAAQAKAESLRGPAAVVIDAQRGEFYIGTYQLHESGVDEIGALRIATQDQVKSTEAAGHLLVGPEITRWFESGRAVSPTAAMLGQLALTRKDFLPGEKLDPIYLRPTAFAKAPPSRVVPP